MAMLKLRQRNCFLLTLALILTPCIIVLLIMEPDLYMEQSLSQRLGECHVRLLYLEATYRTRQEDVAILSQYIALLQNLTDGIANTKLPLSTTTTTNNNNNYNNNNNSNIINVNTAAATMAAGLLDGLSTEARQILRNATQLHMLPTHLAYSANVRLPNSYNYLPHLLDDRNALRPALLRSRERTDVSIVLGIPTVKREKQSYLLGTLNNLIDNMDEEEQNETLIVVFIGETEPSTVQQIAKEIELTFEPFIDNGLIDIVAPSPAYYPDFNRLHKTLNDSLERVKWRSKQNLDFAYLMSYSQTKGTFYVQLEDDILAKRHFITAMKKFASTKSALIKSDQSPWFVLDFCQLGFIGKLFKSVDLPYLITFFEMFYNEKPVDWLLTYFIESKVCRTDKDQKHCNLEKAKYWLHYRPSLFQHIGTSSSLKGKVQKLKDKQFGSKVPAFYGHTHNPSANIKSNIAAYKQYQLKRAYKGETYFWGLSAKAGDLVQFIFDQPTVIKRYLFRSGNSEQPSDRFYNTTVEVLPNDQLNENSPIWTNYNSTADGYLIIGAFDAMGVAAGSIDDKIGAIKEIRLHVHTDTSNWVLLSEIDLLTADDDQTVGNISNNPKSS